MAEKKITSISKPVLSNGTKLTGTIRPARPGKGTVATHCDLAHFDIPGDTHFDQPHSNTTFKRNPNAAVTIKGQLTKDDMLNLAKIGATIQNCKVVIGKENIKAYESFLAKRQK